MADFPALPGDEIRTRFLKFYEDRGHKLLPSASLVPEDPTVLLTIAGMLPFKPIFLGLQESEYPRATTSQKCVRTNDIENVGRTARHHTFFEMLGNFSFGDYFKKAAIAWGWELVTQVFQLPPEQLVVSIFHEDDESFAIWRDAIGIPAHRIQRMGEDNFWASGPTGPCGPCSEIYFDFKPEEGDAAIDLEDDSRFLEIYNLVFMELNRDAEGNLTPLKKQNIDTGLGLERMAQVLQRKPNNYETDLIFPIIQAAADLAGIDYFKSDETIKTSLKVIGDHVRAVVHLLADGVTPSNVRRGYVLRRLIRRLVRHGRLLGIEGEFAATVAETAIQLSEVVYPNVRERAGFIKDELQREESQFLRTLGNGERLLLDIVAGQPKQITGPEAFDLFATHGFPVELTQEIAAEHGLTVDMAGFAAEMAKHRDLSKEGHEDIDLLAGEQWSDLAQAIGKTEFIGYSHLRGTATVKAILHNGKFVEKFIGNEGEKLQLVLDRTPFYAESGGQVGDAGRLSTENKVILYVEDVQKESDLHVHIGRTGCREIRVGDVVYAEVETSKRRRIQSHHTATHLLQAALKQIVDPNVSQAGSLVDADRLRFDFNLSRSVSADELKQIEALVNQWIEEAHDSEISIMPIADAKSKGAIAMFGEKYGAEVRVMDIPGVSMELCGGTHVANTGDIGLFKIVSESSVASGIRRIEAVTGQAVLAYLNVRDAIARELSERFKVKPEEIPERITHLQTELKNAQKEADLLRQDLAIAKSESLLTKVLDVGEFKMLVAELPDVGADALKTAAERLQSKLGGNGAVVLGSVPEADKVSLVAAFGPEVIKKGAHAGKFIGEIAKICGGGGGGRPNLAQAGGKDAGKLPEALQVARTKLLAALA